MLKKKYRELNDGLGTVMINPRGDCFYRALNFEGDAYKCLNQ
jgi:hypothetical protein